MCPEALKDLHVLISQMYRCRPLQLVFVTKVSISLL